MLDAPSAEWLSARIAKLRSENRAFAPILVGWGSGIESVTLVCHDGRARRHASTRWWTSAGTRLGAALLELDAHGVAPLRP